MTDDLTTMLLVDLDVPYEPAVGNDFSVFERFRASGHHLISVTVAEHDAGLTGTVHRIGLIRAWLRDRADDYLLVDTADDIDRARDSGRLGVALNLEDLRCLEGNPELVEVFSALGVRQAIPAFNTPNGLAGGCREHDPGTSPLGLSMLEQLNAHRVLVDLSHVGERSSLEIAEASAAPVVFSHSNASAVWPHYRNLTDAQIRACAASGGVIGISGASIYLGDDAPTEDLMVRHLAHVADLVGIEHVGLGTDYLASSDLVLDFLAERPDEWPLSGEPYTSIHFAPPENRPALVDAMARRGFGPEDVRRVLGENVRRVCGQVWGHERSHLGADEVRVGPLSDSRAST